MENKKMDLEPKVLSCEHGDRDSIYNRLRKEEELFKDVDLKHIFLLAMAIGFKEGFKSKINKKESGGLLRVDSLKDKEKDFIKAIAVASTGDITVLLNKRLPYIIAEEYANGGIKILDREILKNPIGSYDKHLAAKLIDILEKIDKKD